MQFNFRKKDQTRYFCLFLIFSIILSGIFFTQVKADSSFWSASNDPYAADYQSSADRLYAADHQPSADRLYAAGHQSSAGRQSAANHQSSAGRQSAANHQSPLQITDFSSRTADLLNICTTEMLGQKSPAEAIRQTCRPGERSEASPRLIRSLCLFAASPLALFAAVLKMRPDTSFKKIGVHITTICYIHRQDGKKG